MKFEKIDGPGDLDHRGRKFAQNKAYTFGASRSAVKKVYVDAIFKKKQDDEPGPANY